MSNMGKATRQIGVSKIHVDSQGFFEFPHFAKVGVEGSNPFARSSKSIT